ncbi:uncharacterized protein [Phaseolus vulgaris]|uniref:uncharacterized protein n=1 Tax=Phaseolus vulgaris TaxID=3885 RepID=UPI0035CCA84E
MQIFADFVVELSAETTHNAGSDDRWVLSVDGSSNQLGSGAGVILEGPNGVLIEQSLRFAFKASNNQAEYEALIAGILLAKEMGAKALMAKSDSLLITGQVTDEFQAKDPQMAAYLEYVKELRRSFSLFEVVHVPREQNARVDLLAKLASSSKGGRQRTVIQETLKTPRAFAADHQVLQVCKSTEGIARSHRSLTQETLRAPRVKAHPVEEAKTARVCAVYQPDTWITSYQRYIADDVLPVDPTEARKIKKSSNKFTLIDGELYRFGFTHPLLVCVHGEKCARIMTELHEGICRSHIGGRALATRTLRAGYYWPTMREDCKEYAQRCKQCQQHADSHKAPLEELKSIYSPWPFHTWGIDILGPFPLAIRQMNYLVVAIEYFTKWIEAEPVAQITAHKIQNFVWKNIVCHFGVPKCLVLDNGTQFASHLLKKLCEDIGTQQVFASVENPQTNGQVESANWVLLRGLKRRLEKAKGSWAEEVHRIVWAYHTTEQSGTHETPFSLVYGCDAMIPVEIQESSPRFKNFVAEDSNAERRMNLDLLDEVREEARVKAEAVKRRVERKYNSRMKIKAIQRWRPGDEEGPPIRDAEQVVAQVDGTVQSNRSTRKRCLPPRNTGRRGDSSYLERHPSQVLLQLKHFQGGTLFPRRGFFNEAT